MNRVLLQAKQFWATRTNGQRLMLGGSLVATIALLAVFTHFIATPDYKPLMSGLEAADAQAITTALTAKKIPYKLGADGKSIEVPADQVDAARMEVASGQTTHSGRMGFEIFDKVSWGQTEFDEKVNYQRALEGELERTITTLGGVKSARVHLVMATESVFLDRERSAKASVTLKLNRGEFTSEERQAVQRLVAGAVDGLKPSDISVIDADSNEVLGGNGDATGTGEGMEQQLKARLMATLSPVVGAEHLRASVNVEYDQGTTEQNEEKYDPAVSVPLTMQRSEDTNGGGGPAGVPGTTSNVPQNKPNVPAPTGSASAGESSKTESASYGVNKVTRHSIEPAGRIRRITAALVVDDIPLHKQDAKGKWTTTYQTRTPEQLKQIEQVAQAAIGVDTARGDLVTVQEMAFDRSDAVDVPPPSALDRARKGMSDFSSEIRYAMLLVLFAMAYFLMVRPMQKKALSGAPAPVEDVDIAELPEFHQDTLPVSNEAVPTIAALKEQVLKKVKAEPTGSALAVQAWLREEES